MIDELNQIDIMIRARYPIIYILSSEENRVIKKIQEVMENAPEKYEDKSIYIWSIVSGFRNIEDLDNKGPDQDPLKALSFIEENPGLGIYILNDFNFYMENDRIIRKLKELAGLLKKVKKNLIIINSQLIIPPELEKEITVVEFPLPNQQEIEAIFDNIANKDYQYHGKTLDLIPSEEKKDQIIKALMGLTETEITNVLYKSIVGEHKFSIDVFIKEKEQIIRKTGILEYFHSEDGLGDIGGLNYLKDWIKKRKLAFTEKAKQFKVPFPKGLLLLGVQGCGKSLCCRVIANLWNFPLLRLDVGAIFEGIVGSSESNIRKTIKLAESIAPCILWVDEIEKGFSGIKSSNFSDAGTTARVFSTFLTWMQEKTAPVFVVATSNDISALPPEFLRKGRFDEIFFIDLPSKRERKEIFEIHINKRERNPENFDLDKLVEKSEGFSGAEIEAAIISALYDAFDEYLMDNQIELDTKHIISNLEKSVPLSKTSKEVIQKLRIEANVRARPASNTETISKERKVDI